MKSAILTTRHKVLVLITYCLSGRGPPGKCWNMIPAFSPLFAINNFNWASNKLTSPFTGRVLYGYAQKTNKNAKKKGAFLSSSNRFHGQRQVMSEEGDPGLWFELLSAIVITRSP